MKVCVWENVRQTSADCDGSRERDDDRADYDGKSGMIAIAQHLCE